MAQLVVGSLLDRFGPRPVFMTVATMQLVFFAAMPGLPNWAALLCARLHARRLRPDPDQRLHDRPHGEGEARARIYGVRYVVSFTVLAAALPLIAFVYDRWGFDMLFRVLAVTAAIILGTVLMLPHRLPRAQPVPA